jgi:hypothetical protein
MYGEKSLPVNGAFKNLVDKFNGSLSLLNGALNE